MPDLTLSDNWIKCARLLCEVEASEEMEQACLRLARIAAYYAAFHALGRMCADSFAGTIEAERSNRAWIEVYRSLNHSNALSACRKAIREKDPIDFPQPIKTFADGFIQLLEYRNPANYDPNMQAVKSETIDVIDLSESSISYIRSANKKDSTAFASWVLFPDSIQGVKAARQSATNLRKKKDVKGKKRN